MKNIISKPRDRYCDMRQCRNSIQNVHSDSVLIIKKELLQDGWVFITLYR